MTDTRRADLLKALDDRLRALDGEREGRGREMEELRLVRDALVQRESAREAEACAGSSAWFQEVLGRIWSTF